MAFVATPPTHAIEDLYEEADGLSSYVPNGTAWRKDNGYWTLKRNRPSTSTKLLLRPRVLPSKEVTPGCSLAGVKAQATHDVEEVITGAGPDRYRPIGKAWPTESGEFMVQLDRPAVSHKLRLKPIKRT